MAFLIINTGDCYRSRGRPSINKLGLLVCFELLPGFKATPFIVLAGPAILFMFVRKLVGDSRQLVASIFGCYDIFERDLSKPRPSD